MLSGRDFLLSSKQGESGGIHGTVIFTGQHAAQHHERHEDPSPTASPARWQTYSLTEMKMKTSNLEGTVVSQPKCDPGQIQSPVLNKPTERAKFKARSRKKKEIYSMWPH